MTKQQILDTLESLKELTNDTGKQTIDSVKASIHVLQEPEPAPPVPVPEEAPLPAPEPEPPSKVFKPLNVKTKNKPAKKGARR